MPPYIALPLFLLCSKRILQQWRYIEQSITPPQADGVCKGIILSLPPHPTPLPRERELAETPVQADGVLKTLIKTLTDFSHLMKPSVQLEKVGLAIPKGGNRQMLDLLVANSNKTLAELVMA